MRRTTITMALVLALVAGAGCGTDSSPDTEGTAGATSIAEAGTRDTEAVAEQPPGETLVTETPVTADPVTTDPVTTDVDGDSAPFLDEWMAFIRDVEVSPEGRVYAAAPAGIAYLDADGQWMILDLEGLPIGEGLELLPGRSLYEIEIGRDGVIWVSGSAHSTTEDEDFGGEINEWTGGRYLEFIARGDCSGTECAWTSFTSGDVPGLFGIGDLAVDRTGTLYAVGGVEPTLFVFDGTEWRSHVVQGLAEDVTPWSSSLAVTSDGTVWAGTNDADAGRGLYAFDGTHFTHYTTDDGLPSDSTFQVSSDIDGGPLWVATDVLYPDPPDEGDADAAAGIVRFDGFTWTVFTMADGLLTNDGYVAAGPGGTAWVLHSEVPPFGIARYDRTDWAATESPVASGGFRSAADPDGSLWFVSEHGITHYVGTTSTVYASPFTEAGTP